MTYITPGGSFRMSLGTRRSVVSAVALVLCAAPALAASFDVSGPSQANVDTNPATDVSFVVGDTGSITDLNIRVSISGAGWVHDLVLTLINVDTGTQVTLFTSSGNSTGTMNATFDDEAGGSYPTSGDVIGTFTPSPGSLSAFDGEELSGTWTLRIFDGVAPNEGDDLNSWSLFGQTTTVPEPGTVALFGLGALGLAGMVHRRRKSAAAAKNAPQA